MKFANVHGLPFKKNQNFITWRGDIAQIQSK